MANSKAMFVKAPVLTTHDVPGGVLIKAVYMAFSATSSPVISGMVLTGSGRIVVPSSPEEPWMASAWTASRQNGLEEPGYTAISRLPRASRMERVFFVVFANEALPWTVDTPNRWILGVCDARSRANAS